MAVPRDPKAVININKTETEYNMKSIRFLLLTITSMFIVIGILMMVLGTSVYSHYHSVSFLYQSAKAGTYLTPSIMCVFIGFFLLVISSFGFFGSLKRSTCLVNVYAFVLTVILVVKLAVVIVAFTVDFGPDVVDKFFSMPLDLYTEDDEIRREIDTIQVLLDCCGNESYFDYKSVNFTSKHSTVVVTESGMDSILVPKSCCSSVGEVACLRVRVEGCKSAMMDFVVQNARVLGVMGVSVMFILLLGIIFALLLARCIRKMKSEKAMLAWKIREQLILARQDEYKESDNKILINTPQESSVA